MFTYVSPAFSKTRIAPWLYTRSTTTATVFEGGSIRVAFGGVVHSRGSQVPQLVYIALSISAVIHIEFGVAVPLSGPL